MLYIHMIVILLCVEAQCIMRCVFVHMFVVYM